jgi:hypothetical protein
VCCVDHRGGHGLAAACDGPRNLQQRFEFRAQVAFTGKCRSRVAGVVDEGIGGGRV